MQRTCPRAATLVALALVAGCSRTTRAAQPAAIRLADEFESGRIAGTLPDAEPGEPIVWRFDGPPPEPIVDDDAEAGAEEADQGATGEDEGEAPDAEPELDLTATYGFEAFLDVEDLAVTDGLLVGRTGPIPVLRVAVEAEDSDDILHSIRVRMRVSAGAKLSLLLLEDEELDRERTLGRLRRRNFWMLSADIEPGDELRTVTVDLSHVPSEDIEDIRHLLLQPTDAEGATFAIEEIRFVSRREHLASIPSGIAWQGLAEVYRETLVLRAPETFTQETVLPSEPWLDLAIGTIEPQPATFRVTARRAGSDEVATLLQRTVTTPNRWEKVPLDLAAFADGRVELVFAIESAVPGTIGYFGTPVVRNSAGEPEGAGRTEAGVPRGVILILADTLRRDHLPMYGYERDTAPTLARLASEGALFLDNISQGTWTKTSVPSILTSLYPTSNGIVSARDRLPMSVTTLAEVFQEAGYATFATSSVFFTGKLSNLHQGLDVLHERSSVSDLDHSPSKTARTFVDRLTEWLEERRGGPFFAFLHVFDPHDPFEPYAPYSKMWSDPGAKEAHEAAVDKINEWQREHDEQVRDTPKEAHIVAAGVSKEEFVARELDWYDESIRAMDTEIARLLERLESLGLADDTLIAFISDHGEEFLEHGRHFHGKTTYGDMTNVPLILWGPRWVPPGTVVEETVQSLDLMPTLIEIAGLRVPKLAQGRSLMPLVTGRGTWSPRPAISERRRPDFDRVPDEDDRESFAIVEGGYRLVHNFTRPEGMPEYELYDHVADPINLVDLAAEQPQVVADLAAKLEVWRKWAEASRIEGGGEAPLLTAAELEVLDALGYGGGD
ncbi:MAG: hypothetical protein E2O39_14560 [Planctomycetota bacterium]|nr:MAG: hypothetical protein E2O39_14560 [Planctomycetota bacterium]